MTSDSMTSHRTIQHSTFFDWPIRAMCALVLLFSYRYSTHRVVRFVVRRSIQIRLRRITSKLDSCFDIDKSTLKQKKEETERESEKQ